MGRKWTAAEKAAASAAAKARLVAKPLDENAPVGESYHRIASAEGVEDKKYHALLERAQRAEEKLAKALGTQEANEKQIDALQAAQRQGALFNAAVTEVPTGNKVRIQVFDKYKVTGYKDNGNPIVRPVLKTEEVETFYYKIDMPPCGDTHLSINDQEYYHGAVYEFDIHTLRTVKDIVARTWAHDKAIHPGDDNFYRRDPAWQARNSRAIAKGIL